MATETAEEFVYRYTALTRLYLDKNLHQIDIKDSPLLASFMIAYARAVAFAGGSRSLYKTTDHDGQPRTGWIEELTGTKLGQTFEKAKTRLVASAKALSVVPPELQVP